MLRSVGSSAAASKRCCCSASAKSFHTSAANMKKFKEKGPSTVKPNWEPSPLEQERIYERRVKKSEREERMGITRMLEVPKTYMGGFTRPRDLPALKRFAGGNLKTVTSEQLVKDKERTDAQKLAAWRIKQRYEAPSEEAYRDHSLCLVVSRYARRHPPGRAVQRQSFNFSVATPDLPRELVFLNSLKAPMDQWEEMENAVWPWKMTRRLMAKWGWIDGESEEAKTWTAPPAPELADLPPQPELKGLPQGRLWTRIEQEKSEALRYLPSLAQEPFFTPILSVTLPTRPLIDSLERLSKGLAKGTPYFSTISNEERKDGPSFHRQLLRLRLNRTFELVETIAARYGGTGGGFPGIRFQETDVGFGILGERVATGIEPVHRRIVVHVHRKQWEKEAMDVEAEVERWSALPHVTIRDMDAWGYELDERGERVTEGVTSTEGFGYYELLEKERAEKEAEVKKLTADLPDFADDQPVVMAPKEEVEPESTPVEAVDDKAWDKVEEVIQTKEPAPRKKKQQRLFKPVPKGIEATDSGFFSKVKKEDPPHLRQSRYDN